MYLGTRPYDYKGRYVKGNNYDCVYRTISDCVKKGYQDFLMFSDGDGNTSTSFETVSGFKDAMQDAVMRGELLYLQPDMRSAAVFEMLRERVDLNRRTLIFVASAGLLRVVYQAVRNFPDYEGLFPEHIGLIGFDADGWTQMTTPPISAIIPPIYEEGVRAMEELLAVLDGKKGDTEVVFKNIVKWRGTTL